MRCSTSAVGADRLPYARLWPFLLAMIRASQHDRQAWLRFVRTRLPLPGAVIAYPAAARLLRSNESPRTLSCHERCERRVGGNDDHQPGEPRAETDPDPAPAQGT